METNVIVAAFGGNKVIRTAARWQWNYGQIIQFEGIDLPGTFTVHFSNNDEIGTAKGETGTNNAVIIPDEYFLTGQTIYAWIFLHAGVDDGETVYKVIIPINKRPQPTDEEPTPVQQSQIETAIAALNAGVQAAQEAAESVQDMGVEAETLAPGSEATVEKTVDPDTGAVTLEFGIPHGAPGTPGTPGADGISPTITVTDIPGGHRVTITDADGTHSMDVMDGTGSVQDVQVNGVSVLSDGVAEIPIASNSAFGVAKGNTNQGIGVDSVSKNLYIAQASESQVKAGTNTYKPVTPYNEHSAVYFGLSKAAGVDLANEIVTVGTYPDTAKAAIRTMLGAGDVTDVQVNGTSVVSGGVANVPVATSANVGVVSAGQVYGYYGINVVNGRLETNPADITAIKQAINAHKPIVPSFLHIATFYGLAKASGDTTQSASSNPVGTYTENAKSKIQQMLGVGDWVKLWDDTTTEAVSLYTIATDSDGNPFVLRDVIIYVIAAAGTQQAGYLTLLNTVRQSVQVNVGNIINTGVVRTVMRCERIADKWNIMLNTPSNNYRDIDKANQQMFCGLIGGGVPNNIAEIRLQATSIPAGTQIMVYGRYA